MLLITGGFGFIGLNFVELCLKKKTKILVIDKLTYAANKAPDFVKDKNFNFIKCNIGDKKKVHGILRKYKISSIINFAAETHVDNSIKDPDNFVESNILDFSITFVQNLLNYIVKDKFILPENLPYRVKILYEKSPHLIWMEGFKYKKCRKEYIQQGVEMGKLFKLYLK